MQRTMKRDLRLAPSAWRLGGSSGRAWPLAAVVGSTAASFSDLAEQRYNQDFVGSACSAHTPLQIGQGHACHRGAAHRHGWISGMAATKCCHELARADAAVSASTAIGAA